MTQLPLLTSSSPAPPLDPNNSPHAWGLCCHRVAGVALHPNFFSRMKDKISCRSPSQSTNQTPPPLLIVPPSACVPLLPTSIRRHAWGLCCDGEVPLASRCYSIDLFLYLFSILHSPYLIFSIIILLRVGDEEEPMWEEGWKVALKTTINRKW